MSFETVLHIMNDLKTLYDKFNITVKTKKYGHKYRSNLYLRKLGHVDAFLCNLDSIHGGCSLQSYIKRIKAGDCVQSQLTNHLFPSSGVFRWVCLRENFLNVFGLGESVVR